MPSCSVWRKGGGCSEFKGHGPVWETSCTAFWERTKQMEVQPSRTSLCWHYFFPPAQKRWGHPYLRDWNIREYLAWTHAVLPAEDTQTRAREEREREREGREGGREKRAGSGHSDYRFQFWQLKAPQGLLCTRTCDKGFRRKGTICYKCKNGNYFKYDVLTSVESEE